jgi:hypothetical protein
MTTLTVQIEESLMEKAQSIAALRQSSVDAVVADALMHIETTQDPASGFLSLVKDLGDKGFMMPILSREERNART